MLLGHLINSSKWMFHEEYETSSIEKALVQTELVKKAMVSESSIIAVSGETMEVLNYYTDRTFIKFAPETIEKLIRENKLKDGLQKFNVTYALGYDEELNRKLVKNGIKVIE